MGIVKAMFEDCATDTSRQSNGDRASNASTNRTQVRSERPKYQILVYLMLTLKVLTGQRVIVMCMRHVRANYLAL